jgi:hypothetical protein
MVPARFRCRVRATVIDLVAFSVLAFFIIVLLIKLLDEDYDGPPWLEARGSWIVDMTILLSAIVYLTADAFFGMTFGKVLIGVRVMPWAHKPMFLRWSLKILPLLLSTLIALVGLRSNSGQDFRTFTPTFLNSVLPEWLVPATLLLMLLAAFLPFGSDGRPWYDQVANIVVVRRARGRTARGFEPIFPGEASR